MDKHVEHCIHLFESMAESYDEQYAEATKKYEASGLWAYLATAEHISGIADAFRTAARILGDPNWIEKEIYARRADGKE